MAVILVLGVLISATAPLLRGRRLTAPTALAAGAGILISFALFQFAHPDLRAGQAAVQANWRFARWTLRCEVPVLLLALLALSQRKWVFWAGWIIHIAFTIWLIVVVLWLAFFWHW